MEIGNMFTVKNIDVEKFSYPEVEVNAWSNAFGPDEDGRIGSMKVEAEYNDKRITLYKEDVYKNTDQQDLREYLQEMADDWNKNLEENWDSELERCFSELVEYETRQIEEMDEHKENRKKYRTALKNINHD